MTAIMISLFAVGLLGFAVCMMLMSEHFKKLVDIEYLEFHDEWVKDGRPAGGKITRKEQSFVMSGLSPSFVHFRWMFGPPEWAKSHQIAMAHIKAMKRWFFCSIPMWLCVAGSFALAIL